ncbi:hypothetical protein GCM10020227_60990 [Streptomyces flavovirens]
MNSGSVTSSHDPRADASAVAEGLRVTGRDRRPVFGSAFLAGATALLVGGGTVAGGFAAAWDLFLQARRSAESSIDYEESYTAYIGQWDGLVKVAMWVYALLFLVAIVSVAWLLTAQAVTVRHARERADAASGTLTLRALWRRCRPHFGAALRIQLLTLGAALVPGAAGLLVLAAVDREMVPGVVWPTYHEPATVQFLLVGRTLPVVIWAFGTRPALPSVTGHRRTGGGRLLGDGRDAPFLDADPDGAAAHHRRLPAVLGRGHRRLHRPEVARYVCGALGGTADAGHHRRQRVGHGCARRHHPGRGGARAAALGTRPGGRRAGVPA